MIYLGSVLYKKGVVVLVKDRKEVASFPAFLNDYKMPSLQPACRIVRGQLPGEKVKKERELILLQDRQIQGQYV